MTACMRMHGQARAHTRTHSHTRTHARLRTHSLVRKRVCDLPSVWLSAERWRLCSSHKGKPARAEEGEQPRAADGCGSSVRLSETAAGGQPRTRRRKACPAPQRYVKLRGWLSRVSYVHSCSIDGYVRWNVRWNVQWNGRRNVRHNRQ